MKKNPTISKDDVGCTRITTVRFTRPPMVVRKGDGFVFQHVYKDPLFNVPVVEVYEYEGSGNVRVLDDKVVITETVC